MGKRIEVQQIFLFNALFVMIIGHLVNAGRTDWSVEKDGSFWNEQARLSIDELLKREKNTRIAKNVILFLGDGMGVSTVTAGRIRKGQMKGRLGEDFLTEMEQLEHLGLSKTYNIDYQVPDSAATATAYLCGVKAQLGTIGVDGHTQLSDCPSSANRNVSSILDWAQQDGKKVGIITTTRITHATPAAAYAHVADREWESYDTRNFGASQKAEGCSDISYQLVTRSPPIDLLFGGGRRMFYPNTKADLENSRYNGSRTDNRSLIDEFWRGHYIWNRTELDKIVLGTPKPLLGLFERDHLRYESDREKIQNNDPSLSQMTQFAIEHFVKTNSRGFFLLIEGGRIDHGHHTAQPRYALDEFVEFDNAIGRAKEVLMEKGVLDDTLIVVTADHSHVFTMGTYSPRGTNILGFGTLERENVSDIDQLPINILAYGNGPNFHSPRNATYLSTLDTNSTDYIAPAALPSKDETHGGDDVPIFAQGPWSHLFSNTMEQHIIAHKMAYAACWGAYSKRTGCQAIEQSTTQKMMSRANRATSKRQSEMITMIVIYFFLSSNFLG